MDCQIKWVKFELTRFFFMSVKVKVYYLINDMIILSILNQFVGYFHHSPKR